MDIGRGGVVKLSDAETQRRWNATTPQWPIMHAVLYGITRDQMMAKHMANHIQVAYAPDAATANRALVREGLDGARARHAGQPVRRPRADARPAPGGEVPGVTDPQAPCALGLDFGTASVRAVVVETRTGKERGSAVVEYPHGVIDAALPDSGVTARSDWALQHPGDWVASIEKAVPQALAAAGVAKESIVGIGVDFTSCTVLPVDAAGRPLCLLPQWAARPHAWVKLWKHHAAQPQADRINALAEKRGEAFLADYGGKTSSEWLAAKALQILEEDPEVYAAAAAIVEGGDWIVGELSGARVRNSCGAGYKGFWSRESGFPPEAFFAALDPRFAGLGLEARRARSCRRAGGSAA